MDVILAIADTEGVDPLELDFSLGEFINPDVLESLDRDGKGAWELKFVVKSHAVTVNSYGVVVVDSRGSSE